MRKLTNIFVLIFAFTFGSCITTKTYSTEEKKMRYPAKGTYILTTGGQTITGKRVSLPSAFTIDKSYIKLDGKKYNDSDLIAYQDNDAYYKRFRGSNGSVWVKQLKRGAINLYDYQTTPDARYQGGTNTQYHDHFVFEKESAGILMAELSLPDIASLLKDNKKAYETFVARFGSDDKKFLPKQLDKHPEVIMEAVDIYNGNG